MPGLYSHTTRGTGTVLTAAIYNADHQNHIDNQTLQMTDDYSSNAAQMQTVTDPGESGTESLPTSAAGELERLRFVLKELKNYLGIEPGSPQWYSTPTGLIPPTKLDADIPVAEIVFILDGGGIALTTGIKGDIRVPFNCTINSVTLLADQSGSIVVDIWKDSYANYPPTVADTITASAKPTLSGASKSEDTTLTGWTTTIIAGDTLRINIDSAATLTRVALLLKVTKT